MILEPKAKHIVAAIPSQAISNLIKSSARGSIKESEVSKLLSNQRVSSKIEGDWLTVSTLNKASLLKESWSAESTDKFCARLYDQGYATGSDFLEFFATRGSYVYSNDLDALFVQVFNKHASNEIVNNQVAWRLHALAEKLYKGQDSGMVALNSQLQKEFAPFLLNSTSNLAIMGSGGRSAMFSDTRPRFWIGLIDYSEPLLLGMFKARVKRQSRPCLYVKRDEEPYGFFRTTQTIGELAGLAKIPENLTSYGPDLKPFNSFYAAEKLRTDIEVVWKYAEDEKSFSGPIRGVTATTSSERILPGSAKWTEATLPQALKKEIEEAANRAPGF